MLRQPLADRNRPKEFSDIVGQDHLFGEKGAVTKMIERGYISNMIFWGPPGTGKTTAAGIIAEKSDMSFHRLNATSASIADVKTVIEESKGILGANGVLLYLDEIQYFNKKQQQSLLEALEDGSVTLIASTTENPYIYVHNALLSRSGTYEFKAVTSEAIKAPILRGLALLNSEQYGIEIGAVSEANETVESGNPKKISADALDYIAETAHGDVRRSLNSLETAYNLSDGVITKEDAKKSAPPGIGNFDKNGTMHYDLLSALQKSIRGSDPDATIFYLVKILEGGDLIGACRRLQVIASEDVGLAYPIASVIVRSCVESAFELGMPEARIPLSNAAIMLATAPKSNSAYLAYDRAKADIDAGKGLHIPEYMRPSNNFDGYKYPHDYSNHFVEQQYLPNDLKDARYYDFGDNKTEQAALSHYNKIRNK